MKRVVTIVALVALAASFSFADGHMTMYMGVGVMTDGGSWQEVDGRLAQTDASAYLAGAFVPAGIPGKAEYSFDVAYIGGLEDNAIGFGAPRARLRDGSGLGSGHLRRLRIAGAGVQRGR